MSLFTLKIQTDQDATMEKCLLVNGFDKEVHELEKQFQSLCIWKYDPSTTSSEQQPKIFKKIIKYWIENTEYS